MELNVIQLSIRTKKNACRGQSELKANTRKPPDAREKRVTNSRWVQFSFASDWLRGQSEFLDQSIHYWSFFGISFKMLKQSSADRIFLMITQAFANMTMNVRQELCAVMVFAVVEKAGSVVMENEEEVCRDLDL